MITNLTCLRSQEIYPGCWSTYQQKIFKPKICKINGKLLISFNVYKNPKFEISILVIYVELYRPKAYIKTEDLIYSSYHGKDDIEVLKSLTENISTAESLNRCKFLLNFLCFVLWKRNEQKW